MKYEKSVILKNGEECLIRSAAAEDAEEILEVFNRTHNETDFMLTYTDENSFDEEKERQFLTEKENSGDEIELCAVVNGRIAGTAGIDAVGRKDKIRHRAEFGIGIAKDFWGLGIGRAMTDACIECARHAGYVQLELQAVSENARAACLYKSAGFTEYGRNPKGFRSRTAGWQELILMRMELTADET